MAHVKAGGTTKGNRDSRSKRLGVKIYGGQKATNGNIILRQKGSKVRPGIGTNIGNDFTIYALKSGMVKFTTHNGKKFVSVEG